MKKHMPFLILFFAVFASAQNMGSIQNEIDQNLWKRFKKAFEDLDAEKLNSLYAEEVLRVSPNGIDTESSFKAANFERLNGHKESDTDLELDFWFDSRHTNADTSYEVGFYRMRLSNSDGNENIFGQFHIVLKKLNGVWKITQDWDTGSINGKELSAEDFERQKPMQF